MAGEKSAYFADIGNSSIQDMTAKAKKFKSLRGRLSVVNVKVNKHMIYANDLDVHGVEEKWESPAIAYKRMVGDCEEFAMIKWQVLLDSGVKNVMRLVSYNNHLVLVVSSSEDSAYVLDNNCSKIKKINMKKSDLERYPRPEIFMLAKGVIKKS